MKLIRNVINVFIVVVVVYILYTSTTTVSIESEYIYLYSVYTSTNTRLLSDNTGTTDINGVSNFCCNHKALGSVISTESSDTSIDIKVTMTDGTRVRLYFDAVTREFVLFCSDYESCYEMCSYLNERKY